MFKGIDVDLDDRSAWQDLVDKLEAAGLTNDVLELVDLVIERRPKDIPAWSAKSRLLGSLGRKVEALRAAETELEIDHEAVSGWIDLAEAYYGLGWIQGMLTASDRALACDPDDAFALSQRITALIELGSYRQALPFAKRAVEITPNAAAFPFNQLCEILIRLGRHKEALAAANKAVDVEGDNSWSWQQKAQCLMELGAFKACLAAADVAIETDEYNAVAWSLKAKALACLGRDEAALQAADIAIVLASDVVYPWMQKAGVLFRLGRAQEELEAINKVIAIEATHEWAWRRKYKLLIHLEEYEEAQKVANQATELGFEVHRQKD